MDDQPTSAQFTAEPEPQSTEQQRRAELLRLLEDFKSTPPAHDARWWEDFRKEMRANPIVFDAEE